MGKIAIELNIPDEILKTIDLKRLKRIVEREVIIEYSAQKLHGKFKNVDLKKLLREVEEEWAI
ncbi:hypothetical protein [Thermococcus stetteri]|uniref:hypothetical protein n=1 Tax=Thermococcus stetteri TaxID=49900 RepID=UPI001AE49450|nr:hypothetical protein [Thermococcus stetteri]MBP1911685.1 hypothetical protein [Thermococcus stetteri]